MADKFYWIPPNPGKIIRLKCGHLTSADVSEVPDQRCGICGTPFTKKEIMDAYVEAEIVQSVTMRSWDKELLDTVGNKPYATQINRNLEAKPLTDVAKKFVEIKEAGLRNIQRMRARSEVSRAVGENVRGRKVL